MADMRVWLIAFSQSVSSISSKVPVRGPPALFTAVSARAALSRAQTQPLQPSRARPMATARPIPLLEPPTSAALPLSPRSIALPSCDLDVSVSQVSYAFRHRGSRPGDPSHQV